MKRKILQAGHLNNRAAWTMGQEATAKGLDHQIAQKRHEKQDF